MNNEYVASNRTKKIYSLIRRNSLADFYLSELLHAPEHAGCCELGNGTYGLIKNLKELLILGFVHSNAFAQELWLLSRTHFITQADQS